MNLSKCITVFFIVIYTLLTSPVCVHLWNYRREAAKVLSSRHMSGGPGSLQEPLAYLEGAVKIIFVSKAKLCVLHAY